MQEDALDFLDNRKVYDVQLKEMLQNIRELKSQLKQLETKHNKNKSLE